MGLASCLQDLRMNKEQAKRNVSGSGHMTAWARQLSRLTDPPEIANEDHLAARFLLKSHRLLNCAPHLLRWIMDRKAPGAVAYFNARTRHFDSVVRDEASKGLKQLVIIGAGFDSRGIRFEPQLQGAQVFELDLPHVLEEKARRLSGVIAKAVPTPVDLEHTTMADALLSCGYKTDVRTLFLCEGLAYYLSNQQLDDILRFVEKHSPPGSSILFDYVTQAFFDGDYSTLGAQQIAKRFRKLGNVNRSAIDDVGTRVLPFHLSVLSDLDAAELERRYLTPSMGPAARAWGFMRIAHATRAQDDAHHP